MERLLMVIHQYFMSLGVDEIRRRGAEDEKSLRMVKTLVHEICKLMVGTSKFLDAISIAHFCKIISTTYFNGGYEHHSSTACRITTLPVNLRYEMLLPVMNPNLNALACIF